MAPRVPIAGLAATVRAWRAARQVPPPFLVGRDDAETDGRVSGAGVVATGGLGVKHLAGSLGHPPAAGRQVDSHVRLDGPGDDGLVGVDPEPLEPGIDPV